VTSSSSHPLLLCYDGSRAATQAVEYAARICHNGVAIVLTVWQPRAALGSMAWAGALEPMDDYAETELAGAENAGQLAGEGAAVARGLGLHARPLAMEAIGPIWRAIVGAADEHHASMIVMGSRGHMTLGSILLGSVSNAVVRHATQPTLVVHPHDHDAAEVAQRPRPCEVMTAEEMGSASFPASDPPATWTWDPR